MQRWQRRDRRLILVEGEAGIGKSRLMNAFASFIAGQGDVVLQSRVAPGERSPYAPIISALGPLNTPDNLARLAPTTLAALAQIFPVLAATGEDVPTLPELPPEAEKQRLFTAVERLLAACIPRRGWLLVDDAQRNLCFGDN